MIAIETIYRGPTNHSGSRIVVRRMESGKYRQSKTYAWNHELDSRENHENAAMKYIREKAWDTHGEWVFGDTDCGVVAVCIGRNK